MDAQGARSVVRELLTILGKSNDTVSYFRKTPNGLVSLVDIVAFVSGTNRDSASATLRDFLNRTPDLKQRTSTVQFPGQGQRETFVGDLILVGDLLQRFPRRGAGSPERQRVIGLLLRLLGAGREQVVEISGSLEGEPRQTEPQGEAEESGRRLMEALGCPYSEAPAVRQTDDGRASLLDVTMCLTGLDEERAEQALGVVLSERPELRRASEYVTFSGEETFTLAGDLRLVYELSAALPSETSRKAELTELLLKYLGATDALLEELQATCASPEKPSSLPETEVIQLDACMPPASKHLYAMSSLSKLKENVWKIGVASDVARREQDLRTGSPEELRALLVWPNMGPLESHVLRCLPSPGCGAGTEWRVGTSQEIKSAVERALLDWKRQELLPRPVADEEGQRGKRRRDSDETTELQVRQLEAQESTKQEVEKTAQAKELSFQEVEKTKRLKIVQDMAPKFAELALKCAESL